MSEASQALYVLDFDRTLGQTPQLNELFIAAVAESGAMSGDQILSAQYKAESMSISFDHVGYVLKETEMSDDEFREIAKHVNHLAEHDPIGRNLLYKDAIPLLGRLASHDVPTIIMTYGNPIWQQMKLHASGLDVWPHLITSNRKKGHEIASWQHPDTGDYLLPRDLRNTMFLAGHSALRRVVLIDDKASSFEGLPNTTASGYLIRRSDALLPSQEGSVPANVRPIRTLYEVKVGHHGTDPSSDYGTELEAA